MRPATREGVEVRVVPHDGIDGERAVGERRGV
jgi:hypothetical protein